MIWVGIALAGGLGGLARYGLSGVVQRRSSAAFPVGTLAVNGLGAFLFGVVAGLVERHGLGGGVVAVATTGFLGGFTTFSTWMVETRGLAEAGRVGMRRGMLNLTGALVVGIVAVAAGWWLGRI